MLTGFKEAEEKRNRKETLKRKFYIKDAVLRWKELELSREIEKRYIGILRYCNVGPNWTQCHIINCVNLTHRSSFL